ncbi:MAG: hypothetical protein GWN58_00305, partial [Anaerolineae bacterium]|nr:hypothetical protein [Anaerolineae bacterium]
LTLLLAGLIVWAWVSPEIPTDGCTLEQNGAWISADWTAKRVDEADIQQLAEDAAHRQLRYLFPFVTFIQADGSFSPSYGHASEFVTHFRRFDQETLLLAWIGVPLQKQGALGINGWVDLADQHTRLKITTFAASLVQDMGFDGVHLDVETVHDRDQNYLLLLDEVRTAMGPDHLLSAATGYWVPAVVNSLPVLGGYKWSRSYYQEVAVRVDQVVAMTYDSLMPHPLLYRTWMREQVKAIAESVTETGVELLMGVSVSQEKTATHHPGTENLPNGLAGICAALKDESCRIDGVAIYAAWEATPADWEVWERWRGQSSEGE